MSRTPRFDLVIDVRSRLEFFFGHLPGAVCMPHTRVVEKLAARQDVGPTSSFMVYCASGARSADAARQLRAAGYRNVTDGGGMHAARRRLEG